MAIGTNAIVDEKNSFCKFLEDKLELKIATTEEEEFFKSFFCMFSEYADADEEFSKSSFLDYRSVVVDALEQKTLSVQTAKALAKHFLNLCLQKDPLACRILCLV